MARMKQLASSVEGVGKPRVYPHKHRIQIDGPLKELLREVVIRRAGSTEMPQAALIGAPGVDASRRLAHRTPLLRIGDGRSDGDRHRRGDLVLQCDDVGEVAVVALSPDMVAGFS